jgi:hypothetical protein
MFTSKNTIAQDSSSTQLLKLPKINHIGFYVAPEFQYGQLKLGFTGFGGNSFMMLINKKLAVGITSTQSLQRNYSPSSVSPLYLHSNFRGLKLEYVLNGNKAVHLTFPLIIGMATARTDSSNWLGDRRGMHDSNNELTYNGTRPNFRSNESRYMFVQPGVQVEANLLKFMRIYGGVNYRIGWKDAVPNQLAVNTIEGFSANVGVKVGLFEIATHRKKK